MALLFLLAQGCFVFLSRHLLALLSVSILFFSDQTSLVEARRGENGTLSLLIAVPLTKDGVHIPDPGWLHMTAALLAVQHFNDKDTAVVPELGHSGLVDCGLTFGGGGDIAGAVDSRSGVSVIDTGTTSHQALQTLVQHIHTRGSPPDAIAGPYNQLPSLELSVLATGMESPIVAYRGTDHNLIIPEQHPYFSQTSADSYSEMVFLGEYLRHTARTNYIAIVYSSVDSVLQRLETLRIILASQVGADHVHAVGYISPARPITGAPDSTIAYAMERIQQTGFRTIILLTADPGSDSPEMAAAAARLEMDQGDHFYIIPGGLELSSATKDDILILAQGSNNGGFLRGAAFLYQMEPFEVLPSAEDKFLSSFEQQNATFLQQLHILNPIQDYFLAKGGQTFFQTNLPAEQQGREGVVRNSSDGVFPPGVLDQLGQRVAQGSSYIYDAVMSIGIGACLAAANTTNATSTIKSNHNHYISGAAHLTGIRASHFHGASGEVRFGNLEGTPGSRVGSTVYFGVYNLLPNGSAGETAQYSTYLDPETKEWVVLVPFIYADGTQTPPKLLRDTPNQNYLTPGVRIFGLCLMSIALLTCFFSDLWIFLYRRHSVMIASQPLFLYCLCFGSTITSLLILCFSFDESYGWGQPALDASCVALPWLVAMGHIVTYMALFTKLWRINKVLQFKRARIKIRQVAWPALFIIVAAIVILSLWTASGDFRWERDIDDAYSESKWIFALILVQLQVSIVGLPVVAILQSVSTDGRYIGQSLLVFMFAMSNMGLIIFPKMITVRRMQATEDGPNSSTRGSRQKGPKISGIEPPVPFHGGGSLGPQNVSSTTDK